MVSHSVFSFDRFRPGRSDRLRVVIYGIPVMRKGKVPSPYRKVSTPSLKDPSIDYG
jgi:hypothetical protein